MKKQIKTKAKAKVIPIPFPAEHFDPPAESLPEPAHVETFTAPPPDDFKIVCKVKSVAAGFWNGVAFVAMEATDGQNLLDLLRKDQAVTLHYEKNKPQED